MAGTSRQDPKEIAELVQALERSKGKTKGKHGFSCKKSTFPVAASDITVDSWRFQDWDYKRDDLPTYARGLFTTKRKDNVNEIVIRGYDKFFNVGEVRNTEWENVEKNTVGPYELSVKENGCIIFISGLEDGSLLVCSKHSTGARADVEQSHAMQGEKWVKKHLTSVGKTTKDLAMALREMNVTAVGELCDDEFEEHVLEYPPEMAGIYLHGLNFNLPEFATCSGPEVHQFADTWGFKKAQYINIQTLDEAKSFLDKCAETGSWDGRDTEGFVVRCNLRDKRGEPYRDWFFKYKFEEPYLMYRQWRECTKAVIAGKPPKYKKHKTITEQYLLYARRLLAKDRNLGKEYNKNHGIIAMRDGFLAEIGQRGSDIIAQEKADGHVDMEDLVQGNVVLVPIATIGCGKTTVANALVKLFDFGHFQNDNVQGGGNRANRFAMAITNLMAEHRVVIADRNNHQKRERLQIINDISRVVPDARFVALHYVHDRRDMNKIAKVTRCRVFDRGDNHQTIHASKGEKEILGIMDGFMGRFEPCDPSVSPDNGFDEVIDLDPTADSLDNLETIITRLYNAYPKLLLDEMPTHQDMSEAIGFALGETVTLKHDLSKTFNQRKQHREPRQQNGNADQRELTPLTPEQQLKRLEYFGVSVSVTDITSTLNSLFSKAPPDEAKMYNHLKHSKRIQQEFHVTLIHRASASQHGDMWGNYTNVYVQASQNFTADSKTLVPTLGRARLRLERVVWDERIMAFVVRILPSENSNAGIAAGAQWQCANATPHITVGTGSNEVKPKEANDLLECWMAGVEGLGGRIWDKEIPGVKILEGTVKPVMQRGH
jgi:tRNA ligase